MTDFVIVTCTACGDELIVSEHAPEYRRFPFVCGQCVALERLRPPRPADPSA